MRVLSKKTVSPSPTAITTETDSRIQAVPDIAVKATRPSVASTHARMMAPPTAERAAFSVIELNDADSARTNRPMTAQLNAQVNAHSAPRADSDSPSTAGQGRRNDEARGCWRLPRSRRGRAAGAQPIRESDITSGFYRSCSPSARKAPMIDP